MSRKALGRGLSALLSDSMTQNVSADGDDFLEVDIDLIEPNPEQPRTHFDETKLEELAQSIRANGLVQPLLLRRAPGGRYQLVAGERRWRASQRAGLRKVSAVIRDISNEQLLPLALIENIQRQELNPVEEALAYQKLIQDYGLTQEELARQVGKDRSSIANHLRLLRLPADVQRMLEDGRLSMGHARALLSLEDENRLISLAEEILANFPVVDFIVRGDAELPLKLLADHCCGDTTVTLTEIPNLLYREAGTVKQNARAYFATPKEPPKHTAEIVFWRKVGREG